MEKYSYRVFPDYTYRKLNLVIDKIFWKFLFLFPTLICNKCRPYIVNMFFSMCWIILALYFKNYNIYWITMMTSMYHIINKYYRKFLSFFSRVNLDVWSIANRVCNEYTNRSFNSVIDNNFLENIIFPSLIYKTSPSCMLNALFYVLDNISVVH